MKRFARRAGALCLALGLACLSGPFAAPPFAARAEQPVEQPAEQPLSDLPADPTPTPSPTPSPSPSPSPSP